MNVAFYGRHSTDHQNMDTQLQSAYELADKYGCIIVDEYLDPGVSSREKKRIGFERLIKDAHLKKFEAIIIYSHSRLARIPEEHDTFRIVMGAIGIHIIESSTETLYSQDDIVFSSVKNAISKYELDKIRSNTKAAINTLFDHGRWTGGKAPFGYEYDKSTGEIKSIHHEHLLVEEVFSHYKKGHGFQETANRMAKGSYRGKDWNKDRVKNVIINPFYAGYKAIRKRDLSSKNRINDRDLWKMKKCDEITSVITIEEWEYCWDLYTKKKKKDLAPNKYRTSFLLNDLMFCFECKNKKNPTIRGKDQRSKGYGKRIYKCVCGLKWDAEGLENKVKQKIRTLYKESLNELILAAKEKINADILAFEKKEKSILKQIKIKEELLRKYDEEIDVAFREEKDKNHLRILILGKEDLQKQIQNMYDIIQITQKEKEFKNNVILSPSNFKDELMLSEDVSEIENFTLRRLVLNLFERISISPSGDLDYKIKYDNEKINL
jgi:site-specific DNA recombinase